MVQNSTNLTLPSIPSFGINSHSMKTSIASLFLLVFTACFAQAGSFGGPPPFTNGSPLLSGVDGTYQASIRGNNLSGIMKFTYSNGVQTVTTVGDNIYVIFYEGQVISGFADIAINDGSVFGIFENASTFSVTTTTNSVTTATGTVSTVVTLNPPSGYFNGSIDNDSANGNFQGDGEFSSIAVTVITDTAAGTSSTTTSVEEVNITVKGVRVTI